MQSILIEQVQNKLLGWFKKYGRHDLPWQQSPTPYHIWISEIMLQQTQVKTVLPYYERFIKRFQAIENLANASLETVLQHWAGLGYYARARNLHKTAKIIWSEHRGIFPNTFEQWIALPGIGRSTAGAILSFAFHQPYPILDANVKRVFARVGGITKLDQLWEMATLYTPPVHTAEHNQAIMDLGALICTARFPECSVCPIQEICYAFQHQVQHQIPKPIPHKAKPLKKTFFLVVYHQNKILLEKRPSHGIWGGLWSFPETTNILDIPITARQKSPSFLHTFTHFKLEITPVFIMPEVSETTLFSTQNRTWFTLKKAMTLGLPAPSLKLIKSLYKSQW